jgi:heptosyltransferase II
MTVEEKADKILLVQTGFIGDVVLSAPVITNLRNLYPQAGISLLTTPLAAPLFEGDLRLSQVIVFDKRGKDRGWEGLRRMSEKLRSEGFSVVFSLHKSRRTSVLLYLAQIPVRYGFANAKGSWLYSRRARRDDLSHEAERNLAIFRCVGLEPHELKQELHLEVPKQALEKADLELNEARRALPRRPAHTPLVGIAPGSVWATKRWTTRGFAEVTCALHDRGYQIVLIGGSDDVSVAQEIERKSSVPLINLVGTTDLLTSAAVISRLRLLITNDSSPLHIASACATPVVAVFCATVPEFGFGPWFISSETVGLASLSCRPCGRHGGRVCPTGTYACMEDLSPAVVIEAALRVLARGELCLANGLRTECCSCSQ